MKGGGSEEVRMKAETGDRAFAAAEQGRAEQDRAETVGLITLSHRGDLERCALLFESIDRHAASRGCHYVLVDDRDVALFAHFARPDRLILPQSQFLPWWIRPIPFLRRRRLRYWLTPFGKPVSGWHIQQFVKIEATRRLPEARYCLIDSDVCFFRDFDLAALAEPNPTPFHVHPGGVGANRPRHIQWLGTASRLLATKPQSVPADDYIDQIIIWDQATTRAMTDRIEAVTGRGWVAALCRDRHFSEYMIYGTFVTNTPSVMARHAGDDAELLPDPLGRRRPERGRYPGDAGRRHADGASLLHPVLRIDAALHHPRQYRRVPCRGWRRAFQAADGCGLKPHSTCASTC